jgi:hypothetical protein
MKERAIFCKIEQKLVDDAYRSPTLSLATVLNAGIVHEGIPFSDFSVLAPLYTFFGIFFTKLESMTLILPRGPYSKHSLNGKRGFDFRGGPYQ